MASLVRASSLKAAASGAAAAVRRPAGAVGIAPQQHRAQQHADWAGRVTDGTVKWFDPAKGFGFITVAPLGDVFFHVSVVGDHHRPALLRQARLRVRLGPGPKTLQVVEILGRASADHDSVPAPLSPAAVAAVAVPEPCAFPF